MKTDKKTDNFWNLENPHVPSLELEKAVLMMPHCSKSNCYGLSTSPSKIGELNSKPTSAGFSGSKRQSRISSS